jgi:hypothetical protein
MAEATQWKESVRPSDEAIVVRSRSDAAGDSFTASQVQNMPAQHQPRVAARSAGNPSRHPTQFLVGDPRTP